MPQFLREKDSMPQFLLPESTETYERFCREARETNEAIRLRLQTKAGELGVTQSMLAADAVNLLHKSTKCAAEAELNRRQVKRKDDGRAFIVSKIRQLVELTEGETWREVSARALPADYDGSQDHTTFKTIGEQAEEQVRKAEQEKIVAGAEVILGERPSQYMRQLLQYEGKFFVCRLENSLNAYVRGNVKTSILWMTDSLEQMTDLELGKIVELSQSQS